jgi:hypothetical protein
LHALPRPRQHVIGNGRLRLNLRLRRCFTRRRQRRLEGAYGVLEGEAVRFQNLGGKASRVTHDGGQYDGAVDVPPAASARSCRRGLENAPHLNRDAKRIGRRRAGLRAFENTRDDVALDPFSADVAGIEHGHGIRIVAESREQMLKRDLSRARCAGEFGAASQRRREFRRHRDLRKIWCRYAHDISVKEGQDGQDWP